MNSNGIDNLLNLIRADKGSIGTDNGAKTGKNAEFLAAFDAAAKAAERPVPKPAASARPEALDRPGPAIEGRGSDRRGVDRASASGGDGAWANAAGNPATLVEGRQQAPVAPASEGSETEGADTEGGKTLPVGGSLSPADSPDFVVTPNRLPVESSTSLTTQNLSSNPMASAVHQAVAARSGLDQPASSSDVLPVTAASTEQPGSDDTAFTQAVRQAALKAAGAAGNAVTASAATTDDPASGALPKQSGGWAAITPSRGAVNTTDAGLGNPSLAGKASGSDPLAVHAVTDSGDAAVSADKAPARAIAPAGQPLAAAEQAAGSTGSDKILAGREALAGGMATTLETSAQAKGAAETTPRPLPVSAGVGTNGGAGTGIDAPTAKPQAQTDAARAPIVAGATGSQAAANVSNSRSLGRVEPPAAAVTASVESRMSTADTATDAAGTGERTGPSNGLRIDTPESRFARFATGLRSDTASPPSSTVFQPLNTLGVEDGATPTRTGMPTDPVIQQVLRSGTTASQGGDNGTLPADPVASGDKRLLMASGAGDSVPSTGGALEAGLDESTTLGARISTREAVGAEAPQAPRGFESTLAQTLSQPSATGRSNDMTAQLPSLPDLTATPDSQDFPQEMMARLRLLQANGAHEAKLNLHPAELGRMTISITTEGDTARVAFTVDNPQAREALEQAMPRLRDMLSQAGLQLADSSVFQHGQQQAQQFAEGGTEADADRRSAAVDADAEQGSSTEGRTPDPDRTVDAYV